MKPNIGTVSRTIILVLTIINSFLAIIGKSPLPIDSDTVTQIVSLVATTLAALAAWWKNNSFSQAAMEGDIVMRRLKAGAEKADTEEVIENGLSAD